MANDKPDTLQAAHQVIVLAFDLVDAVIPQSPVLLKEALLSANVQGAIQKTLLDFAKSHRGAGGTTVSSAEARALVDALGTGVKNAATDALLNSIKKTPEYRRLEASVRAFQKTAESSALGVWIDRHKQVLYVVGAALVVGGSTALYITRTGGPLVGKAVDVLKGKEFEVLQIGTLNFTASLWEFQPDARVLGARIGVVKQWERVTMTGKFGVLARGADVEEVDGAAVLVSGPFGVTLSGNSKPQTRAASLGLTLDYTGVVDGGSFNIGLGGILQNDRPSAILKASHTTGTSTFGLQGNIGQDKDGRSEYGIFATFEVRL